MPTFNIDNVYLASDFNGLTNLEIGTFTLSEGAVPTTIFVIDDDDTLQDTVNSASGEQTLDASQQVLQDAFDGHPAGTSVQSRASAEAILTDPDGNTYNIEINQLIIGGTRYFSFQADVLEGSTFQILVWNTAGGTSYVDLDNSTPISVHQIDQVISEELGNQIYESFTTNTPVTINENDLQVMFVNDEDPVLQDNSSLAGQSRDDNVQNLDAAFTNNTVSPEGAYVYSRSYVEVLNQTTGETGRLYQIKVVENWDGVSIPSSEADQTYYAFNNDFMVTGSENIIATTEFQVIGDVLFTDLVVCFTAGTKIKTSMGQLPVERLRAGDMVMTASGQFKEIRWIGSKSFDRSQLERNPKLLPVHISAGALQNNLPKEDLLLSPQHRVLVKSGRFLKPLGVKEALLKAKFLVELPGVYVDEKVEGVEYFHILFDQHEVIYANGMPCESLYLGDEAAKMLDEEAVEEIRAILPEAFEIDLPYAAPIPHGGKPAREAIKRLKEKTEALQ